MQYMTKRIVAAGDTTIMYNLTIKNVRNINLRVHRDGNVFVSAPRMIPIDRIDEYVESQVDFILRAQRQFLEQTKMETMPLEYVTGDTIPYLGKRVPLLVEQSKADNVIWGEDQIVLQLEYRENQAKRSKVFRKAFLKQQDKLLTEIFWNMYDEMKDINIPHPELRFRSMKSRWGSCQPATAVITLNRQLITKPIEFIEYVAVHEIAHLLIANHSQEFYKVVETILPDWKERKRSGVHSAEDMVTTDEDEKL